jgi:hypothetical protein
LRAMASVSILTRCRPWSLWRLRWRMDALWGAATAAIFVVAILVVLAMGAGTPFLYFQF